MNKLLILVGFSLAQIVLANETLHINQLGCNILNGDSNFIFKTFAIRVESYNKNSIACLTNIENHTGRFIRWDYKNTGYVCVSQYGLTDDWYEEIDSNGNVILICNRKS